MPPNQDWTSNGKHIEQDQRPQLLCVLLMQRIYAIDLALIPLLGNVAEIQNFPMSHQDLSMEKRAMREVVEHIHTFEDH